MINKETNAHTEIYFTKLKNYIIFIWHIYISKTILSCFNFFMRLPNDLALSRNKTLNIWASFNTCNINIRFCFVKVAYICCYLFY